MKKKVEKVKKTPRLMFKRKTGTQVHPDKKKQIKRKQKYKNGDIKEAGQ